MNKFLLIGVSVLGLFLSSEVYCACMPPITRCECAFPEFKNGVLSCGPTYCPSGTTCMPMGSCCKNDKVCGSELFPSCCSDTESCMSDGSCCTTPNQAKTQCCDTNGNGVANDDTCCPALETEGCETEVDETTGCSKCKTSCTGVSNCSGQTNGTVCCTSDGVAGLCLNSSCQTKTCASGEKLYVYYPKFFQFTGDVAEYGSPALGCCTQDPSKTIKNPTWEGNWGQLCCTADKPVYTLSFADDYGMGRGETYTCATHKQELTECETFSEGNFPFDTLEECRAGDYQEEYSYCENGYGDWECTYTCEELYDEDSCEELKSCYRITRKCL